MAGTNTPEPRPTSDASTVHRLETGVEWPPGHAAAYLVTDDEPILVDAGMAGSTARRELLEAFDGRGVRPSAVDHLLVTHVHIDHVGQVGTILELADPTVYAPTAVRTYFERDLETVAAATRRNLVEAGVDDAVLGEAVATFLEIHRGNRDAFPLDAVDVWIGDAPVEVGTRLFEPIHTPGHHATHHCYGTHLGDERVVFAGDMVVEPFRAAAIDVNFDDGVDEAVDEYFAALERLADCSFDRVYPGHGPIHDRYAETVERTRQDLEERLETCLDRLGAAGDGSAVTAFDLVVDRADDTRRRVLMLRETVAALTTLERTGRVRSWVDEEVRLYEPA